ncbi:hypothetical protein U27_03969 [Candidatus Vecturithrix granuli]|uniref:Flippase-like domain-containing protein n=1 Tax=Vecturithrix granuli TaxID=1499967 RepID=A0A081BXF0_VECG1|nr:hypothetical protein U27_03969 [Candidatus Vecturithrix granuli]
MKISPHYHQTMQQNISKSFSLKTFFPQWNPTNHIIKLLSLGFGVILLSWLISQLEWSATLEILRNVPVSLLLAGFMIYGLSFYLRALRLQLLLPAGMNTNHLFPIVLIHYMALNLIPARLGELSYVYLLKRINGVPTGYSISNLLIARIFDQFAIAFLFLVSVAVVDLPTQWLRLVSLSVGIFFIVTLVLLIVILAYKERVLHWIQQIVRKLKWHEHPLIYKVMREIEGMVAAFREIQVKAQALRIFGLSVLIWIGIFSLNYVLLVAFHVSLSYIEVILTSTFIILIGLLPLRVFSMIGVHETTWVFIALALGISRNVAITAAIGTHILLTFYLFVFGGYGLWRLQRLERKKVHDTTIRNKSG